MPNTLVHLGVQSVSSKALFRNADFKLIALGCIIPDIPWILQRGIIFSKLNVNIYDLIQYATVQASFFFCLILCGAIALFWASPGRAFLLLTFNAIVHLILDATQIKWANGVHFFAPFSWKMTSFELAWPEHPVFFILTIAGFFVLLFLGFKDYKTKVPLTTKGLRYAGIVILFMAYVTLPILLRNGPNLVDSHYTATFSNATERTGKQVELDRSHYNHSDKTVKVFSRENIKVTGPQPPRDEILSLKGQFIDNSTIRIAEYHVHSPVRDSSSAVALAGIALIWLIAIFHKRVIFQHEQQN